MNFNNDELEFISYVLIFHKSLLENQKYSFISSLGEDFYNKEYNKNLLLIEKLKKGGKNEL